MEKGQSSRSGRRQCAPSRYVQAKFKGVAQVAEQSPPGDIFCHQKLNTQLAYMTYRTVESGVTSALRWHSASESAVRVCPFFISAGGVLTLRLRRQPPVSRRRCVLHCALLAGQGICSGDGFPGLKPLPPNAPHDDVCAVCGEEGNLLCCDFCPKTHHLDCLVPPMQSLPQVCHDCLH